MKEHGHGTLMAGIVALALASPIVADNNDFRWLLSFIFFGILLAAARAVMTDGLRKTALGVLGLLALVGQIHVIVKGYDGAPDMWVTVRLVASGLFLGGVALAILSDILRRTSEVNQNMVLGAINVYLLAGMGFATVYALVDHLSPGSFTNVDLPGGSAEALSTFNYFSFVTMSTLGYGDISPLTNFGRTIASLQAAFGPIYLAVLVARLVGLFATAQVENMKNQG